MSVFRLFWWTLASGFVPGCLCGSAFLAQNLYLSEGSCLPCEIVVIRGCLSLEYWLPSSDCGLFGGCLFLLPFYAVVSLVFVWPVPGIWTFDSCLCCFIRWFMFRANAPFLCF